MASISKFYPKERKDFCMKSTTKKLLHGVLLTVCLAVLMAVCAGAEDVTYSEGLEFTSNGDGTCYVSGIGTCTDSDLYIPPMSPAGEIVTSISNSAFFGNKNLIRVIIPEGMLSIGVMSFASCENLSSIKLPESLTTIREMAFYYCHSITSIEIPKGVNCIETVPFNSRNLVSIVVDEDNTVYHSAGNCLIHTESKTLVSGCKSSIIPNDQSVTSIGNWAFLCVTV